MYLLKYIVVWIKVHLYSMHPSKALYKTLNERLIPSSQKLNKNPQGKLIKVIRHLKGSTVLNSKITDFKCSQI